MTLTNDMTRPLDIAKAATTMKVSADPIVAIQKVARAGPNAKPVAKTPSCIELARSSVIRAGTAMSGTRDFRAVGPAAARTFLRVASTTSQAIVSSHKLATKGSSSVSAPVTISAQTATRLLPYLSIIDPMTGMTTKPGIAVKATTKPA